MEYTTVPLRTLLKATEIEEWNTTSLENILSNFKCTRDQDREDFLQRYAIPMEKQYLSRTYLIFDTNKKLVGFYSLGMKCMATKNFVLSKRMRKSMNVDPKTDVAQSYLIGQLARSDDSQSGLGERMLKYAIEAIKKSMDIVGCGTIRVDCSDALVPYCTSKGFNFISKNKDKDLNIMVAFIRD